VKPFINSLLQERIYLPAFEAGRTWSPSYCKFHFLASGALPVKLEEQLAELVAIATDMQMTWAIPEFKSDRDGTWLVATGPYTGFRLYPDYPDHTALRLSIVFLKFLITEEYDAYHVQRCAQW